MKRCLEKADRMICPDYPEKCTKCRAFREPTNADRIRAMSDEELAAIIMCPIQFDEKAECIEGNCFQCSLKWLHQPCGEEDKHETD